MKCSFSLQVFAASCCSLGAAEFSQILQFLLAQLYNPLLQILASNVVPTLDPPLGENQQTPGAEFKLSGRVGFF